MKTKKLEKIRIPPGVFEGLQFNIGKQLGTNKEKVFSGIAHSKLTSEQIILPSKNLRNGFDIIKEIQMFLMAI